MTVFASKKTLVSLGVAFIAVVLVLGVYTIGSTPEEPGVGALTGEKQDEPLEPSAAKTSGEESLDIGLDRAEDFFVNYRLDRERVRGQQVELLQGVVEDPNSDAAMRKEAQNKLIKLSDNMDKELQLETLIKAKGFNDAALFIQPETATAILEKEGLTEGEVASVADIISRVTGHNLEDIVVIPK